MKDMTDERPMSEPCRLSLWNLIAKLCEPPVGQEGCGLVHFPHVDEEAQLVQCFGLDTFWKTICPIMDDVHQNSAWRDRNFFQRYSSDIAHRGCLRFCKGAGEQRFEVLARLY